MEKFVAHIYNCLKSYNKAILFTPKEDVLQEIRYAVITAQPDDTYRAASRQVNSLLADYGFSRKKGKDNFSPFYYEAEISHEEKNLIDTIEHLYTNENLTAREVARLLKCNYTPNFQKLMHQCFPKGLGHGGARKGSGKKKSLINQ